MGNNIAVVYEKGLLRPLQPLNLPEQTQLEIVIVNDVVSAKPTEMKKAYQLLVQAGLIQPWPSPEEPSPVPLDETALLQAADTYGQAGSLSELIIAERNEP